MLVEIYNTGQIGFLHGPIWTVHGGLGLAGNSRDLGKNTQKTNVGILQSSFTIFCEKFNN